MIKVDDLIEQLEKYRGGKVERVGIALYNGTSFSIPVNGECIEIYITNAWCDDDTEENKDIEIVIK